MRHRAGQELSCSPAGLALCCWCHLLWHCGVSMLLVTPGGCGDRGGPVPAVLLPVPRRWEQRSPFPLAPAGWDRADCLGAGGSCPEEGMRGFAFSPLFHSPVLALWGWIDGWTDAASGQPHTCWRGRPAPPVLPIPIQTPRCFTSPHRPLVFSAEPIN